MDKKFLIACFYFRKLNIVLRSSVFTKMVRCFHVTVALMKGPFTQAIFVAATRCNFCGANVATSKSHV